MLILETIVIGAVGTAIAGYFQNRAWKYKQREEQKVKEVGTALELFKRISEKMDVRLYSMRRAAWSVGEEDQQEKREQYQKTLYNWNETLNRDIALIERYFGQKKSERFEQQISWKFVELGRKLGEMYRKTETISEEQTNKFNEAADKLQVEIRKFDVDLIRSLQREEVGIFRPA